MRQHSNWTMRTARSLRSAIAAVAGLACALFALPAYAQSSTVAGQSPWVMATVLSVSAVFVLWGVAAGAFRIARRLRWVPTGREAQVSRALQVTFGGLLLLSVFMPYLAMHHPVVALGLVALSLLWVLVSGCGQSRSGSETTPHS